jgi:hypothetical protein
LENGMTKDKPASDPLEMLVGFFEEAEQASEESRAEAERCRDYRNGDQWTAEEVATLNKRKQPIVTIDRIGPKVDFLLGMESSNRTDPKAYPRTPNEEQGAEAATDALRFVMDDSMWDQVRSQSFDSFIVEGVCGADIQVTEKKQGDYCIEVKPMFWDRLFFDPHSRRRNFSDAKYKGQFIWKDLEDCLDEYPEHADKLNSTMAAESIASGQTYDDVPRLRWADPKRKRVRIVEIWTKEGGKVFHTKFTKAGILKRIESPFKTEDGEADDGFVFGSCYVDRDGNRFGVVRRWLSLQDEINKRRSKAMHLMNTRQTYGNALAGDKNKLKGELAKPDGHVEMEGDAKYGEDFGVIPTNELAAAQFDLLQEAKQEIDSVGVNAAMQGTEQRAMSGRALMVRDEQGKNELGPVFDWFSSWQLEVYRKIWCRVRQFWTAEKWIRVTDDERNVRFVGLNQPLTLGDKIMEDMRQKGVDVTPEMEQQAKESPALQQVVGTKNSVAEMDVDITLDSVPATASLQIEQFQALADLAGKGIPIPPDALIEASSIRNKDKILDSMRGGNTKNPAVMAAKLKQAEQQLQEMAQKLQEAESGMAAKRMEIEGKLQQASMAEQSKAQLAQLQIDSAERIAAMNNETRHDIAELTGAVSLMAKSVGVPDPLAKEVEEDLAKEPDEAKPDPMMLLAEAIGQMNKPKRKRSVIQAPSGQVYQVVTEDEDDGGVMQ